ncbi:hypothetical protein BZL29_0199 [Mycobacterium kansasii]|uniref:Uncharacterized protein n=1 Tax=Mycobacterium kansasii TaxID=1768 RepID=A0A1V3XVH8_MYCKA|nr:hypothetical protein BZL29_0199 [Mycobacterium kansasii]
MGTNWVAPVTAAPPVTADPAEPEDGCTATAETAETVAPAGRIALAAVTPPVAPLVTGVPAGVPG